MSVFDHIVGQQHAVAQLQYAVEHPEARAQSWLICGQAGSGRNELARSFAAALQCPQHGCGECSVCRQVLHASHPDVSVLSTQTVNISIDQVREIISTAEQMPATAPWRIIIIEDVERMQERTTNVLLKEIEEPSSRTIWLLCAPSAQDVLPTIRSRTRIVQLGIPTASQISQYLQGDLQVEQGLSDQIARLAQGNITLAQDLAHNPSRLHARVQLVQRTLAMRKASDAVLLAGRIISQAQSQAQTDAESQVEGQAQEFLRANGLSDSNKIPPKIRSAYQAIKKKDVVKRLATRRSRDELNQTLETLASVYRDVLVLAQGADRRTDIVNEECLEELTQCARRIGVTGAITRIEAVETARARLDGNGNPTLVFEALLCTLLP